MQFSRWLKSNNNISFQPWNVCFMHYNALHCITFCSMCGKSISFQSIPIHSLDSFGGLHVSFTKLNFLVYLEQSWLYHLYGYALAKLIIIHKIHTYLRKIRAKIKFYHEVFIIMLVYLSKGIRVCVDARVCVPRFTYCATHSLFSCNQIEWANMSR